MCPVMKKLVKILSTILILTILVGVGWYFFPTEQVKAGAKNLSESVQRIRDKLDADNISADGVKVDSNSSSDTGDVGEGLSFSATSCPYRALLSVKQQGVYNQIYANARDLNDTFKLVCTLSVDELSETYVAVICDHPEIFWLDNRYQYGYSSGSKNTATQLTLEYNGLKSSLGSAKAKFNTAAAGIINGAAAYKTPAEKEKYVFDAINRLITYDDKADYNQTAYSGLVGRRTVCAGYARAFQYVLNKLDIPCYYIFGTANGEYHAWNIVQLDGQWYNVDLTWSDQPSGASYTYYNITDATFSANHTRSAASSKLPAAGGTKYSVKPEADSDAASKVTGSDAGADFTSQWSEKYKNVSPVSSVDDYNSACYTQIVASGAGSYSFSMVLSSETLYDEILASSKRGDYKAGYLDAAANALGIKKYSYNYSINGDLNEDTGLVLLTQKITLKKS